MGGAMNPDELRVAAVARFKQGKEALANGDCDDAVSLFQQALELTPRSAQIRRALRDAQCKSIPQGRTLPKLTSLKLLKLRAQMKIMEAAGDWENLERVAEEAAAIDPWDIETNAMTAAATYGLEFLTTAFVFYQRVAQLDPTNLKYLRRCASLLEHNGQDDKAFDYWQKIHQANPNDALARKRVKECQARDFITTANFETSQQPRSTDFDTSGDTVIDEGDTAHGEKTIPVRDPDGGFNPDSGLSPDSGMGVGPGADAPGSDDRDQTIPLRVEPSLMPSDSSAGEKSGPSGPPRARTGPADPPSGPGPSRPPLKAGPSAPARSTAPSSVPGAGPKAPPASVSRAERPADAGPSDPPTGALSATRPDAASPSSRAFSVPIPDDMPDHVQNLLAVANSMIARNRPADACSVLEKALTHVESDEWIEGMLMLLKRRPR